MKAFYIWHHNGIYAIHMNEEAPVPLHFIVVHGYQICDIMIPKMNPLMRYNVITLVLFGPRKPVVEVLIMIFKKY